MYFDMLWRVVQICFMVNHGLDVEFHAVLEAVHWLIDGCDEERDGADVVPTLNFLVRESGMPPDAQVRPGQKDVSISASRPK